MSDLTNLQNALSEYKADRALANTLKQLTTNVNWKKVIDEGYVRDLPEAIVKALIGASPEQKEQHLSVLTGISAFTNYLETINQKGILAEDRIRETEDAITTLQEQGAY